MDENLILLPSDEVALRHGKVQAMLHEAGIDGLIVSDNANLFYLCGRVFAGYAYIPAEGDALWFVRRPVGLEGDAVRYIRKPEDIPGLLEQSGAGLPQVLALEFDLASYNLVNRLALKLFISLKIKYKTIQLPKDNTEKV